MSKQQIVFPSSNRVGKFNLMHTLLADPGERAMLKALFGLCVVIEASEHESGRGKTYIAASDLFEPLREGEEIPEYRIEFAYQRPLPQPDWEARKVVAGDFSFVAIRNFIVRVPTAQMAVRPRAPGAQRLH